RPCRGLLRSLACPPSSVRDGTLRLSAGVRLCRSYGFRIPGAVLRDLMQAGRVELFINLMWRELRMTLILDSRAPGRGAAWMAAAVGTIAADGLEGRARQHSSARPAQ